MDVNLSLLIVISALASFVQGFCGFGYGILAMAALSFLTQDMERASVYATLSGLPLIILLMVRSHKFWRIDWKLGLMISAGLLAGNPIGYWFIFTFGSMPVFRFAFGLALVLFALYKLSRPHLKRTIPAGYAPAFGFVSGLLSGAFSSGGPPVVLYLYSQEDDPRAAVGTTQLVFLLSGLYRLFIVEFFGRGISLDLTWKAGWVTPVLLLMTFLAYNLANRCPHQVFLATVNVLIMFAGIANIFKSLPFS